MWYLLKIKNKVLIFTYLGSRNREVGDIIPARVEQSATYNGDETNYGAELAIDMNMETKSIAVAGSDGKIWIKLYLGEVHCIQQVKRNVKFDTNYGGTQTYRYTWICTEENCDNCEGPVDYCKFFTLTVNTEGTATSNLPSVTDCKYGDTVKVEIDSGNSNDLSVSEIWIIGKQGRVRR